MSETKLIFQLSHPGRSAVSQAPKPARVMFMPVRPSGRFGKEGSYFVMGEPPGGRCGSYGKRRRRDQIDNVDAAAHSRVLIPLQKR